MLQTHLGRCPARSAEQRCPIESCTCAPTDFVTQDAHARILELIIIGAPLSLKVFALSACRALDSPFLWACRGRRPRRLLLCVCVAALALLTLPLPCLRSVVSVAEEPACRDEIIKFLFDCRLRRLGRVARSALDWAASTSCSTGPRPLRCPCRLHRRRLAAATLPPPAPPR